MNAPDWPSYDDLQAAHRAASATVERLGLVIGQHRGFAGRWLGPGIGSSIEYEDHRPFVAGDDPRYLDWAAYARSGQWMSKVYREEVAPQVDVVIDVSRSMFLGEDKRRRALELAYFAVMAADRSHAALNISTIAGAQVRRVGLDVFLSHHWLDGPSDDPAPAIDLRRIAWRGRSLRVVVSDLLFPGTPTDVLRPLAHNAGHGILFAPYGRSEIEPALQGACRLVDCETGATRVQQVDATTLGRFQEAYQRHFDLWRQACRKAAMALVRVDAESALTLALQSAAAPEQAVVPWT